MNEYNYYYDTCMHVYSVFGYLQNLDRLTEALAHLPQVPKTSVTKRQRKKSSNGQSL